MSDSFPGTRGKRRQLDAVYHCSRQRSLISLTGLPKNPQSPSTDSGRTGSENVEKNPFMLSMSKHVRLFLAASETKQQKGGEEWLRKQPRDCADYWSGLNYW